MIKFTAGEVGSLKHSKTKNQKGKQNLNEKVLENTRARAHVLVTDKAEPRPYPRFVLVTLSSPRRKPFSDAWAVPCASACSAVP